MMRCQYETGGLRHELPHAAPLQAISPAGNRGNPAGSGFRSATSGCRLGRGFTLIELLVVVFVIALLVSFAFPVLSLIRQRAWRTSAYRLAQQVSQAWNIYLMDNRAWPDDAAAINRMDRETCRLLNRSTVYLEIESYMLPHGFLDPWGQRALREGRNPERWQVRVALDHNYDGTVTYLDEDDDGSTVSRTIRRSVIAWSVGPDGLDVGEAERAGQDNVVAW